jgi:hypothetical protein
MSPTWLVFASPGIVAAPGRAGVYQPGKARLADRPGIGRQTPAGFVGPGSCCTVDKTPSTPPLPTE